MYFEIDLIRPKCAKDILKNLHGDRHSIHARIVSPKLLNKFVSFSKHGNWKQHIGFVKILMHIYLINLVYSKKVAGFNVL